MGVLFALPWLMQKNERSRPWEVIQPVKSIDIRTQTGICLTPLRAACAAHAAPGRNEIMER